MRGSSTRAGCFIVHSRSGSIPHSLRVTIQGVAVVLYVAFLLPLPYDCHSERSRGEGCKDRKEKAIPRRSRSFAEKERCVSTVRSKTKGCFAPRRDMVWN